MNVQKLNNQDFMLKIDDIYDLPEGSFILRIYDNVKQTGVYRGITDDGSLLLSNVVDLNQNSFIADEGLVKPTQHGKLYYFNSFYCGDTFSNQAIQVIRHWSLYQKSSKMQPAIISFVKRTFAPHYILFLKEQEKLDRLFVPIQQYFKIGRCADKSRWEDINVAEFKSKLDTLLEDQHITYIGHLPESLTDKPVFYTAGNFSHLETDHFFKEKPCLSRSNCGGNIKLVKENNKNKTFVVDAGASYKGKGVNARKEEASVIAGYLKKIYPEYLFKSTAGRGAIGTGGSF